MTKIKLYIYNEDEITRLMDIKRSGCYAYINNIVALKSVYREQFTNLITVKFNLSFKRETYIF